MNARVEKPSEKIGKRETGAPFTPTLVSRRILIVEDETEILNAYKDILSGHSKVATIKSSRSKSASAAGATGTGAQATASTAPGTPSGQGASDSFEVTAVSNGEDALQAVKKAKAEGKPFALGFFDVLLGAGIDGIETVRRIHELDSDMYAVLVTAYQDRHVDSIQQIFGKEFEDRWDYLNKPFSEGEILQKARGMVSMWNIRRRESDQREWLDALRRKLADSEKMLTVAAVARSVGHEFGNILLQIMGRADLSRDKPEAEMRKALDTILLATEHASKVLDRFKNLAKPHHSHERRKMKIAEAVKEALTLIDHELQRRHIEVSVKLDDLPLIQGNHATLVQVFMNLIINALHAMEDGGRLIIGGRVHDGELEISVRDSGHGIPEENLQTVFDPFFTTKGDHGTGLGLAICKEITEITHGGKISAHNHPEGGAEFKLFFPMESSHDRGEGT